VIRSRKEPRASPRPASSGGFEQPIGGRIPVPYRQAMARKALYFPYIRTPDDPWFTRVLLYWDAVGTILPGGLEDDARYVTPRMRELRESGGEIHRRAA